MSDELHQRDELSQSHRRIDQLCEEYDIKPIDEDLPLHFRLSILVSRI